MTNKVLGKELTLTGDKTMDIKKIELHLSAAKSYLMRADNCASQETLNAKMQEVERSAGKLMELLMSDPNAWTIANNIASSAFEIQLQTNKNLARIEIGCALFSVRLLEKKFLKA